MIMSSTKLKISTITLTAKLPIADKLSLSNIKNISNNNFKNQVSIRWECCKNGKKRNVSIKIFESGKLQITGVPDMNTFTDIYRYVCNECYEGIDIKELGDINYEWIKVNSDLNIQMINSNINCGIALDLYAIQTILVQEYSILAMYNPLSYAAVNAKYKTVRNTTVTLLIFSSGNFMITGSKNYHDLVDADKFRHKFLVENEGKIRLSNHRLDVVNKTDYNEIYDILTY